MKIKHFILSGMLLTAMLSLTVFAEPETTEKETEPTKAITEVTETETSVSTESLTTAAETTAVTTSTTTKETTPSFYDEILAYVGEDNAPVLNDNLNNDAMTIDSSTIDYSSKSMYTITTRSGDVFYLIINSSDGSVYFLNSVDTADLTAMLSDSNSNSLNENAIENIEQSESATENSETVSEIKTSETNTDKKPSIKSNIIWIIAVVIGCTGIGGIITIFKKKRKTSSFDDDYFNDEAEPERYDDSIVEYTEPSQQPQNTDENLDTQGNENDYEEYFEN